MASSKRTLFMTRIIVSVGLIVGMLISWKLWYSSERLFPHLPVSFSPTLLIWLEVLLILSLWGSLIAALFKKTRFFTLTGLLCMLVLALADQTRWQPWVYQYGLMLPPLIWLSEKSSSAPLILKIERFILIAIYFWSGFHKCGEEFAIIWKGNVMKPWLDLLDPEGSLYGFIVNSSTWVPWFEMALAVVLIFSKTRWLGIIMACAMHLGVLI